MAGDPVGVTAMATVGIHGMPVGTAEATGVAIGRVTGMADGDTTIITVTWVAVGIRVVADITGRECTTTHPVVRLYPVRVADLVVQLLRYRQEIATVVLVPLLYPEQQEAVVRVLPAYPVQHQAAVRELAVKAEQTQQAEHAG